MNNILWLYTIIVLSIGIVEQFPLSIWLPLLCIGCCLFGLNVLATISTLRNAQDYVDNNHITVVLKKPTKVNIYLGMYLSIIGVFGYFNLLKSLVIIN